MNATKKIVLGTVQFGCQYGINSAGRPDEKTVGDILSAARGAGINVLDTSSAYGNAEEVLGICGTDGFNVVSKYPKGNIDVLDKFNITLKRIKQKSLYGYLLHHFEVYQNNPSVWDSFRRLRDERKVQRIGFSLYQPEELELLLDRNVDFSLLQVPYNLFDRKFELFFTALHERGVEIHVRSTFLQGLFFMDRNKLPEKLVPLRPYLTALDEYANSTGLTIAQLALNYNLHNAYINGVLIGVDNLQQLQTNVMAVSDIEVNIDIDVKEKELLNPVNWK